MELLVAASIAYATDHGEWPQELAVLPQTYPDEITTADLRDPAAEGDLPLPHFCYIRPAMASGSNNLPILFQHPAIRGDNSMLVCFGDGHREIMQCNDATAMWQRLRQQATRERNRTTGLNRDEWDAFWQQAVADDLIDGPVQAQQER